MMGCTIRVLKTLLNSDRVSTVDRRMVRQLIAQLEDQFALSPNDNPPPRIERWQPHHHAYRLVAGVWESCESPRGHIFRSNADEWMKRYYPCNDCQGLGVVCTIRAAAAGTGWNCDRCDGSGIDPFQAAIADPCVRRTEENTVDDTAQTVMSQVLELMADCPDGWSMSQYAQFILKQRSRKL